MTEVEPEGDDPDLGKTGRDYPLWRAREAVAQGEKMLGAQIATVVAHETRSQILLQWLSAEALGLIAIVAAHHTARWLTVGIPTGVAIAVAGGLAVYCLRPKTPHVVGVDPNWLLSEWPEPCELTTLEAIARMHATATCENTEILADFAKRVRRAWAGFLSVPAVAVIFLGFSLVLA